MMCVCICLFVYIYIYIRTQLCIYIEQSCVCAVVYAKNIYVCIHTHTHVYRYMHVEDQIAVKSIQHGGEESWVILQVVSHKSATICMVHLREMTCTIWNRAAVETSSQHSTRSCRTRVKMFFLKDKGRSPFQTPSKRLYSESICVSPTATPPQDAQCAQHNQLT